MQPSWPSTLLEWVKSKLPFAQHGPAMEESAICRSNLILDFEASESEADRQELRGMVSQFPKYGRILAKEFERISLLSPGKLKEEAEKAIRKSLRTIVLLLTGECNMNCRICATDRKKSPDEIRWEERREVLEQARAMGAKRILTPGWGEPTMDHDFWKVAEYAKENKMQWIVVTNGLLIDEGMARRLAEYPVSLSIKFWSTDPEVFYYMARPKMGPEEFRRHFSEVPLGNRSILVPRSLALTMETFPRDRLSIGVAACSENSRDTLENIIPFAEKNGIEAWVEPVAHVGRYAGRDFWDLGPEQEERMLPHYKSDALRRVLNAPVDHEGAMCSLMEMPPTELKARGISRESMRLVRGKKVGSLAEMRFRHPQHRKELLEMKWKGGLPAKLQKV